MTSYRHTTCPIAHAHLRHQHSPRLYIQLRLHLGDRIDPPRRKSLVRKIIQHVVPRFAPWPGLEAGRRRWLHVSACLLSCTSPRLAAWRACGPEASAMAASLAYNILWPHCETTLTSSFAFQTAFAAYSVPNKTDRFYDLAGSLGFISTTLVSLVS